MTSRERELHRALLICEGIAFEAANDHTSHPGVVPAGFTTEEYIKALQKIASDVYKVAHSGSGRCCKGGIGDQFQVCADKIAAGLKTARIMDVDKILDKE